MSWKFTDDEIAYKFADGVLTTCIDVFYSSGEGVQVSEGEVETFKINSDGTIEIGPEGFKELTQFNYCHTLWGTIHLLNTMVAKHTVQEPVEIDLVAILQDKPVFTINRMTYNQLVLEGDQVFDVDLGFEICFNEKEVYSGHMDFLEFAFIRKIENHKWTVTELANFVLHFQKFLVEAEEGADGDDFLSIDEEILALLKDY